VVTNTRPTAYTSNSEPADRDFEQEMSDQEISVTCTRPIAM
jgi:hypothetical protein